MNGRNYQDLVLLTPETRKDPESRGTVLVSGQRGINTNTTLDGMDFDNGFFGGTFGSAEGRAPLSLSQESIKEFTVIRNGASVEFGPSGGGVINVITKNGTNEQHGSAFYYTQPHETVAKLAVPTGSPAGTTAKEAPDTKKKQYGGSDGGPIFKDHLFYFVSYDEQKQDVGIPVNSIVLDPDDLRGVPGLRPRIRPTRRRRTAGSCSAAWTSRSPAPSDIMAASTTRSTTARPRHHVFAQNADEPAQRHRGTAVPRLRRSLEQPVRRESS